MENTAFFREGLALQGFKLLPGEHPIVPVMLEDAVLASEFAARMLEQGGLCGGVFISCGSERQGAYSHPDVGSTQPR